MQEEPKKINVDIWMPLFIGDFLSRTTRLNNENLGAYLLLQFDYWKNGPIPDDDLLLANISRMTPQEWKKERKKFESLFVLENGLWNHTHLEAEKTKAINDRLQKINAGRRSAQIRKLKLVGGKLNGVGNGVDNGATNGVGNGDLNGNSTHHHHHYQEPTIKKQGDDGQVNIAEIEALFEGGIS
jgi:uncharacterized protein YdaU (DUF1376 family)